MPEDTMLFDYGHSRVSDIKSSSVKYIDEVLSEIKLNLTKIKIDRPLTISLKENYLTDDGVKKICNFILEDEYLKRNITTLDLSNNRFTKKSLQELKCLLENCPKLKLDVSINYIGSSDFTSVFQESDFTNRINFSVF